MNVLTKSLRRQPFATSAVRASKASSGVDADLYGRSVVRAS
jgi:hypothetical protein